MDYPITLAKSDDILRQCNKKKGQKRGGCLSPKTVVKPPTKSKRYRSTNRNIIGIAVRVKQLRCANDIGRILPRLPNPFARLLSAYLSAGLGMEREGPAILALPFGKNNHHGGNLMPLVGQDGVPSQFVREA